MIKSKSMSKVSVFGPRTYLKEVIETMYDLDVVHIDDHIKKTDDEFFDIGEPYDENERYAGLLVKLRAIISNLNISRKPVQKSTTDIDIIEKKTNEIHARVKKLLDKSEYYEGILSVYKKKEIKKSLALLRFSEIDDPKDKLHYVGYVDMETEHLREIMNKEVKDFDLEITSYQGLTVMGLIVDSSKKKKVDALLDGLDFSPIDNPVVAEQFDLKTKSGVRFVKLDREVDLIRPKLEKVNDSLNEIKHEHAEFFLESELLLKIESEKAEAPLRFASSKNTFLVKGWVPQKNKTKLQHQLNEITEGKVHVEFHNPGKSDDVPIAYNHPKIVQPFESFMDLYSLPTYRELDPTFFMFLTFPIFFGFMLGDFGYGLIIFLIFTVLKMKMPSAKNLLNAFIIAAIVSMVFGLVFGEYFGVEEVPTPMGKALGIHPMPAEHEGQLVAVYYLPFLFHRSEDIVDLMSVAVLFGVVHLLIGYIIGFVNVLKEHGLVHAVKEKVGWMLLFPGVLYLLTDFLGVVKGVIADSIRYILPPMPVIEGLAILGIVLIVIGEGAQGAVELPALLSNILSYARLMAVGLASLSLAMVVNTLAGKMFTSGIGGIIAGILVLIMGHTINIALGVLSPFLHALRLHYVEFFTKFFHGGGRRYVSFGHSE